MGRRRQPPSQTWRTFLRNHVGQIVAADFFVVPTATYRLLFVLVLLAHDRRRIRHVAVTAHPTAAWTAQQLREAFPWDEAPRYLLHDRDHAFDRLGTTAKAMGIEEVLTAPRAPWQNAFVERFIGSARRECLDHVIVFNEAGLLRLMTLYCSYYERSRTHLSLDKDTPIPRPVTPSSDGAVVVASRRSAVSIIATNAARPERPSVVRSSSIAAPTDSQIGRAGITRQLSVFDQRCEGFGAPARRIGSTAETTRRRLSIAHKILGAGVQITGGNCELGSGQLFSRHRLKAAVC